MPLVWLCHTMFCHRKVIAFGGWGGEHLRIALISVNLPTVRRWCYSLGKTLHPHPLLVMRICALVQRKGECHLPLREHGSSEKEMSWLWSCCSLQCPTQYSVIFSYKVNNKWYFKKFYGKWEHLFWACHWHWNVLSLAAKLTVMFEVVFVWKWTTNTNTPVVIGAASAYLWVSEYFPYKGNWVTWQMPAISCDTYCN